VKRQYLETLSGLLPENHGQNLALAFLYVPRSLKSSLISAPLPRESQQIKLLSSENGQSQV
jgi:hypothetical protein